VAVARPSPKAKPKDPDPPAKPYHHGDLRQALLDAAVEAIVEDGSASFSLRDLARRIGVSHAAPAHHFGDKTGLLTALAAEGYGLLADAQAETWERTHDFLEVGVAYARFALDHPAHFEVMYRPELLRADDPDLVAARGRSGSFLYGPAGTLVDGEALSAGVAGWALVHGIVALWINGNLPPELGDDPEQVVRLAGRHLFSSPGSTDALGAPG
jgi:AcrR family transcriptional regulator